VRDKDARRLTGVGNALKKLKREEKGE